MPNQDASTARHFAGPPDPRIDRTRKHQPGDILVVAPCAVVCGADSWEEVEGSGAAGRDRLRRPPTPPGGTPSHDTFGRVSARLDPAAFGTCAADRTAGACEAAGSKHTAVGGEAARSAPGNAFGGRPHPVGARAAENRLTLGRQAVADGSHEIAAIPRRLKVPGLKGALVAVDAAGCRKETGEQARGQDGHHLLAAKGNPPALHRAVCAAFDRAGGADPAGVERDGHEAAEDGRGRREERCVTAIYDPQGLPPEWPGVAAAVILVGREREVKGTRPDTAHCYVTSRRGTAAELGTPIRRHWPGGNERHWCPGAAFREDENKTAAGPAGANLGLVRRVAASLPSRDPEKGSIKAKRPQAGWDDDYRLQVPQGFMGG